MAKDTFHKYFTKQDNGCWVWTAGKSTTGYGKYRGKKAHRVSYERFIGPIPEGLNICHKCDNPLCVNPSHLWAGTQLENMGDASRKKRIYRQSYTHCLHGHEYTPENSYIRPGKVAGRDCRECIRNRVYAYRKRNGKR